MMTLQSSNRYSTPPRQRQQEPTSSFHERQLWRAPPAAPKACPMPELMKALSLDESDRVAQILQRDPAAAKELFEDHSFEPPLCFAIRRRCSHQMLDQLLHYGADPTVQNISGKSAISVLIDTWSAHGWRQSGRAAIHGPAVPTHPLPLMSEEVTEWNLEVARSSAFPEAFQPPTAPVNRFESDMIKLAAKLLKHGADPFQSHRSGLNAIDEAELAGARRLASVLRHYHGMQACLAICRVGKSMRGQQQPSINRLCQGVVGIISSFLVPKEMQTRGLQHLQSSNIM